jgi:hypothetical protein
MVDIVQNQWNEADASNTNASPNGLQGGYAPNAIAPTIRQIMGATKRAYVQNNAIYTSTGSAGNYVLTYAVAPSGLSKGIFYSFWPNHTNTGAATLNINALGAKSIIRNDGAALTASQITTGNVVTVVYDGTNFRLQSPTTNPTFTGQVDVGSLVSAGSITGTAGNLSSLGVTGDITLAGTLKVSPTNGINFANDDTITYDDSINTWFFEADKTGGSLTSRISTNKLLLTAPTDAIRLDTPVGDTTSNPYLGFYKGGTLQGYVQHQVGTSITNGIRLVNSLSGDNIVLNNSGDANALRFWDSSAAATYTIMHTGNGGAGTGFDADKVDGYEAANLYRHNASFATGGNLQISNGAPEIKLIDTTSGEYSARLRVNANNVYFDSSTDDVTFGEVFRFELDTKNGYVAGSKIVTLANDGAGSTVDADLLDGQHGAFYQSASNLNAGTIPSARVAGSYTGITGVGALAAGSISSTFGNINIGTATFTGNGSGLTTLNAANLSSGTLPNARLVGDYSFANLTLSGGLSVNPTAGINFANNDYLWFNDSTNTWQFDADGGSNNGNISAGGISAENMDAYALQVSSSIKRGGVEVAMSNVSMTAGNGLSGGGTLAANRTFTLGTPSDITNSTTNSVTSTSHTHALGFTAAEVYTGSTAAATSFGVGHVVMVHRDGAIPATNGTMGIANRTDNNYNYINSTHSLAGGVFSGTWRSRGIIGTSDYVLMQRTA